MGNLSPRPSKSYHEGFSNHLNLRTPNRSSWKKQLQLLNETLHIRKSTKQKSSRSQMEENRQQSFSIQNFRDLNKKICNIDQRENNVKKSLSLFSIKQPLNDSTNREQIISNSNQRRRSKTDLTSGKLKVKNIMTDHTFFSRVSIER